MSYQLPTSILQDTYLWIQILSKIPKCLAGALRVPPWPQRHLRAPPKSSQNRSRIDAKIKQKKYRLLRDFLIILTTSWRLEKCKKTMAPRWYPSVRKAILGLSVEQYDHSWSKDWVLIAVLLRQVRYLSCMGLCAAIKSNQIKSNAYPQVRITYGDNIFWISIMYSTATPAHLLWFNIKWFAA